MDRDGLYRGRFYGDWVDAYSMDGKAPDSGGTSYPLMESAYAFYDFHLIAKIADLLGHREDASPPLRRTGVGCVISCLDCIITTNTYRHQQMQCQLCRWDLLCWIVARLLSDTC